MPTERQQAMLAEMGIRLWPAPDASALVRDASPDTAREQAPSHVDRAEPRGGAASASSARAADAAAGVPARPAGSAPSARQAAPSALREPDAAPPAQRSGTSAEPVALDVPMPARRGASEPPALPPSSKAEAPRPSIPDARVDPALAGAFRSAATLEELQSRAAEFPALGASPEDIARVFGLGHAGAGWMLIGELPTDQDDAEARPFAGKPGQLLDQMLLAVGARLDASADTPPAQRAYATLALKGRGPADGHPAPEQVAACRALLLRQIELVAPKIVLAMGRLAVACLLGRSEPLGKLRGHAHEVPDLPGVRVVVTYPPSYLLRHGEDKARAWEDLCLARELLEQQPAS